MEEFGECSIKAEAEKVLYTEISFSEQKRLAKLIVRLDPYVTEAKRGEILVKKNHLYIGLGGEDEGFKVLKYILGALAAILTFILFNIILPNIKK